VEYNPSQKVIEHANAQAFYNSLVKKYDVAAEKLYSSGSDADLLNCFTIGDVLMDARDHVEKLKAEIAEEQTRVEEEGTSYEDEQQNLAVFNPYSYLTFNRYTLYTYLIILGIVAFIMLCARIGW